MSDQNSNIIAKYFTDKVNLVLFLVAAFSSGLILYLDNYYNTKIGIQIFVSSFSSVKIFILFIFLTNFILSFIVNKKDRYIAWGFNFLTICVSILISLTYLFFLLNPNG